MSEDPSLKNLISKRTLSRVEKETRRAQANAGTRIKTEILKMTSKVVNKLPASIFVDFYKNGTSETGSIVFRPQERGLFLIYGGEEKELDPLSWAVYGLKTINALNEQVSKN